MYDKDLKVTKKTPQQNTYQYQQPPLLQQKGISKKDLLKLDIDEVYCDWITQNQ